MRAATFSDTPTARDKEDEKTFLPLYFKRLPCPNCRRDALDFYAQRPLTDDDLSCAEAYSFYVWSFHDRVNAKLGKRRRPDFEQCKRWFSVPSAPRHLSSNIGTVKDALMLPISIPVALPVQSSPLAIITIAPGANGGTGVKVLRQTAGQHAATSCLRSNPSGQLTLATNGVELKQQGASPRNAPSAPAVVPVAAIRVVPKTPVPAARQPPITTPKMPVPPAKLPNKAVGALQLAPVAASPRAVPAFRSTVAPPTPAAKLQSTEHALAIVKASPAKRIAPVVVTAQNVAPRLPTLQTKRPPAAAPAPMVKPAAVAPPVAQTQRVQPAATPVQAAKSKATPPTIPVQQRPQTAKLAVAAVPIQKQSIASTLASQAVMLAQKAAELQNRPAVNRGQNVAPRAPATAPAKPKPPMPTGVKVAPPNMITSVANAIRTGVSVRPGGIAGVAGRMSTPSPAFSPALIARVARRT